MECKREKREQNMKNCNCSYEPCARKGVCCECIAHHRSNNQLPACFFPDEVEKTYDRSKTKFVEISN
ncbi:MAG: hypothetical protein ISS23_00315 [Nanoarchaeota archaeon]|nr:hypothetical protein [Nanoarchaeota archaeon]